MLYLQTCVLGTLNHQDSKLCETNDCINTLIPQESSNQTIKCTNLIWIKSGFQSEISMFYCYKCFLSILQAKPDVCHGYRSYIL